MTNNKTEQEELNIHDKAKKRLKTLAIGAGVLGGVYLLGAFRGYDIGYKIGHNRGNVKGYEDAMKDMYEIIKESKANISK